MNEYNFTNSGCNNKPNFCGCKNIIIFRCFRWNMKCQHNCKGSMSEGYNGGYNDGCGGNFGGGYGAGFGGGNGFSTPSFGGSYGGCQNYYPSEYYTSEQE